MTVILIFYQGYVARLAPLEYQELLLTLKDEARPKILAKTRRLRRGLAHQLDHARVSRSSIQNSLSLSQRPGFPPPCKIFRSRDWQDQGCDPPTS
jgi:hypothetical protein